MNVAFALAALLTAAPADPDVTAGEAAYRAGNFAEAAAAFARAYARTRDPTYLYTQAQAERQAGNCRVAIELYQEFLGSGPSDQAALAVRDHIAACTEQLADEPEPEPAPASTLPLDPTAEAHADPEPALPPADPTPPPPTRPWHRDPLGGVLVGSGLATAVGGAVVLGLAHRAAGEAENATDDRAYGDGIARAHRLEIAGAVVTSVGAALLVGGIARWVVLARRDRDTTAHHDIRIELGRVRF